MPPLGTAPRRPSLRRPSARRGGAHVGLAVLLASGALGGCAGSADPESRPMLVDGRAELDSTALGHVVVEGTPGRQSTFVLRFPDAPGAAVTGASAFMPAHGHGTVAPEVRSMDAVPPAWELARVRTYMPGRWAIDVVATHDGHEETLAFDIDVP